MNPDNTDSANSANPPQAGGAAPTDNSTPSLEDTAAELAAAATTGNLNGENPAAAPAPTEDAGGGLDLTNSDGAQSTDSDDTNPEPGATTAEDLAETQPLTPAEPLPGSIGSVKSGPALPDTDLPAAAAAAAPAVDPAANDPGMSALVPKPTAAPEPAAPAPVASEPAAPASVSSEPAAPMPEPAASAPIEPTPVASTPEAVASVSAAPTPEPVAPAPETVPPVDTAPTPNAAPTDLGVAPADPATATPPVDPTTSTPSADPTASTPAQPQAAKLPRAKGKFPLIPVLAAVLVILVIGIIIFFVMQNSQNNSQPEVVETQPTEVIVQYTSLSCTSEETDLGDGITATTQEYIANYVDEDLQDISSILTVTYEDESTATNALTILKENYNTYVSETLSLAEDPFDSSFILDEDDPLTVIMTQNATADLLDTTTGRYFNMVSGIEDEDEESTSTSDDTTAGTITEPTDDTESTSEETTDEDEETVSSATLVTTQSDLKKLYEGLGFTCQVTDTADEQEK